MNNLHQTKRVGTAVLCVLSSLIVARRPQRTTQLSLAICTVVKGCMPVGKEFLSIQSVPILTGVLAILNVGPYIYIPAHWKGNWGGEIILTESSWSCTMHSYY